MKFEIEFEQICQVLMLDSSEAGRALFKLAAFETSPATALMLLMKIMKRATGCQHAVIEFF